MSPFKDELAKVMEERDLNRSDIARIAAVNRSRVSEWASGKSVPSPRALDRLTSRLGLNLEEWQQMCGYRVAKTTDLPASPQREEAAALVNQIPDEHVPTVVELLRNLSRARRNRRVTDEPDDLVRHKMEEVPSIRPRRRPYEHQSVTAQIARYGFQPAIV